MGVIWTARPRHAPATPRALGASPRSPDVILRPVCAGGARDGPPNLPAFGASRRSRDAPLRPVCAGGARDGPPNLPAFGASRRSRDAEIGLDGIERSYYFLAMRKGEQTREAILVHALRLATKVGFEGLTIGR